MAEEEAKWKDEKARKQEEMANLIEERKRAQRIADGLATPPEQSDSDDV